MSRHSVYLSWQKFQRPRDQTEDRLQGREWLRLWMHCEKYRQSEDCCTRNNRVLIKERGGWRRTYSAHKIQSSKSVFKEAVSVSMRLLFWVSSQRSVPKSLLSYEGDIKQIPPPPPPPTPRLTLTLTFHFSLFTCFSLRWAVSHKPKLIPNFIRGH